MLREGGPGGVRGVGWSVNGYRLLGAKTKGVESDQTASSGALFVS